MSIFGTLMSKLGFGDKAAAPAPVAPAPTATAAPVAAAPAPVAAPQVVDIVACLDDMCKANGSNLNWQTSIVDLLKLVGMDSSLEHRKELAKELNCPADIMHDSASMNIWLHKNVLTQLAMNGGNVPANLLG